MDGAEEEAGRARPRLAAARLALGLGQGLALYLLWRAIATGTWPATDRTTLAASMAIAAFLPVVLLVGMGRMRSRTLGLWSALVLVVLVGLAAHAVGRSPAVGVRVEAVEVPWRTFLAMSPIWFIIAVALFIGQALVSAGDAERRWIASYGRYFDVAWKQGVQVVLAWLFVGVFWGLLTLGASLFRLLGIQGPAELLSQAWFALPATFLAIAGALHLTDVSPGVVRGVRTLKLTLFSALLPILVVMAVAFLAVLPFVGLDLLWATRRATPIILTTAAGLVFLLNAAFQDGAEARRPGRLIRLSSIAGAVVLTPLVAIAVYGLALRVGQYGWTPERVVAAACLLVAACYAIGYGAAALVPGGWMRGMDRVNVAAAFLILATLGALFSPVADPARIAVADQVRRLQDGRTPVDRFDFAFLRFDGARYGIEALERLRASADGPEASEISKRASGALMQQNRYQPQPAREAALTAQERAANIVVQPAGTKKLPDSFLLQNWTAEPAGSTPRCLVAREQCSALLVDLDGDDAPEVLLFAASRSGASAAYKRADGSWRHVGSFSNTHCPGVRDALKAGDIHVVEPRWRELSVAGQRLRLQHSCGG